MKKIKWINLDNKLKDNFKFGVELEFGINDRNIIVDVEDDYRFLDSKEIFLTKLFDDNNLKISYDDGFKVNGPWIIGGDGSINVPNSIELKSPILVGEKGLKQLEKVLNLLKKNKFRYDNSCGLHVHVGLDEFNTKTIKNIIILYTILEKEISKYLAKHRKNNNFCRSFLNNKDYLNSFTYKVLGIEDKYFDNDIEKICYDSKYHRLNVLSIQDYNTLEFRQHEMTFDFKAVENWIRFISLLFNKAKKEKSYTFVKCIEEKIDVKNILKVA